LNLVNCSLHTQLHFLPEILNSRVLIPLILESMCVTYCSNGDWWRRYRYTFYSPLTWHVTL